MIIIDWMLMVDNSKNDNLLSLHMCSDSKAFDTVHWHRSQTRWQSV